MAGAVEPMVEEAESLRVMPETELFPPASERTQGASPRGLLKKMSKSERLVVVMLLRASLEAEIVPVTLEMTMRVEAGEPEPVPEVEPTKEVLLVMTSWVSVVGVMARVKLPAVEPKTAMR